VSEFRVRVLDLASQEAKRTRDWYAARSEKAAERFLEELDAAVNRVRSNPQMWPRIGKLARRCRFRGFPFDLVYLVHSDEIVVIAVAHHRRKPGYWSTRQ
jgi:toxin ParE1/3/4